jgi:D-alanine--poly(phosphoribitol) ligase subunit 1
MSRLSALNLAFPFFCQAVINPHRVALVTQERSFTYSELANESLKVAHWFRSRVSPSGRPPRIGVLGTRSWPTYAGILGAAWAGGTYIPLNPKLPTARLACIVKQANLDSFVGDAKYAECIRDWDCVNPSLMLDGANAATQFVFTPSAVAFDHAAYVMFTSGTTGIPKGVAVSTSNVSHYLACIQAMYHIGPEDRVAQFSDTSFDVSVFEMFATWQGGAALHVLPETELMAPAEFIKERGLTVWSSVPSVIKTMSWLKQLAPAGFPSVRVSCFGGEGLPTDAAKAWQTAAPNSLIFNQYGPTECTIACIYQRLDAEPVATPGRGMLAVGKPYPGTEAEIVGSDLTFLRQGEIGELAVMGPQVAMGYLNDEESTNRRFPELIHPQLGKGRWYLTGDRGFRDKDGMFHCLGRVDHQVKVLGNRVELEEIEAHLRSVCGTDAVAAVAWPLIDGNVAGIVAFVCRSQLTLTAARDQLRQMVPSYMVPQKVLSIESLPLSCNGKVDRQALFTLLAKTGGVASSLQ